MRMLTGQVKPIPVGSVGRATVGIGIGIGGRGLACPVAENQFDVVVVGGGAAGLTASRDAHRRGARTLMVQSGPIGGDCTFTGCVPSKTMLSAAAAGEGWSAAMGRVQEAVARVAAAEDAAVLGREGIETRAGWATFTSPRTIALDGTAITADQFVIATGAAPAVSPIDGLDQVPYLTSDDVFDQQTQPRSLAILGGGPIGCELAQAFARLGTEVTVVEGLERVLSKEETRTSEVVTAALLADGVHVRTGAKVEAVRAAEGGVRLVVGDGEDVTAERLLVAVGRRARGDGFGLEEIGVTVERGAVVTDETMATNVDGIWAVGDVTGRIQLTHAASKMAQIAVRNALAPAARLRKQRFAIDQVPWAVFTDPEVGRVGRTEGEAAEAFDDAKVAELPFAELDRAITAGRTEGFIKLIAAPRTGLGWMGGGKVVGATVVGPTGGDLIHEAALAMRTSMFTGRLAQTTHVYPSWSMAVQLAAGQFFYEVQGREARPARAD